MVALAACCLLRGLSVVCVVCAFWLRVLVVLVCIALRPQIIPRWDPDVSSHHLYVYCQGVCHEAPSVSRVRIT